MIFLVVMVTITAVLRIRKGTLAGLGQMSVDRVWLAGIALAAQTLLSEMPDLLPEMAGRGIHLISYGMLITFVVLNHDIDGMEVAGAGVAANAVVAVANGGVIPARAEALLAAGRPLSDALVIPQPRLAFLGDIFAVPHGIPFANVFSLGDIVLLVGFGLIIAHAAVADDSAAAADPAPAPVALTKADTAVSAPPVVSSPTAAAPTGPAPETSSKPTKGRLGGRTKTEGRSKPSLKRRRDADQKEAEDEAPRDLMADLAAYLPPEPQAARDLGPTPDPTATPEAAAPVPANFLNTPEPRPAPAADGLFDPPVGGDREAPVSPEPPQAPRPAVSGLSSPPDLFGRPRQGLPARPPEVPLPATEPERPSPVDPFGAPSTDPFGAPALGDAAAPGNPYEPPPAGPWDMPVTDPFAPLPSDPFAPAASVNVPSPFDSPVPAPATTLAPPGHQAPSPLMTGSLAEAVPPVPPTPAAIAALAPMTAPEPVSPVVAPPRAPAVPLAPPAETGPALRPASTSPVSVDHGVVWSAPSEDGPPNPVIVFGEIRVQPRSDAAFLVEADRSGAGAIVVLSGRVRILIGSATIEMGARQAMPIEKGNGPGVVMDLTGEEIDSDPILGPRAAELESRRRVQVSPVGAT